MKKTVRIGSVDEYGDVFCRIEYENERLSITGVEGPKRNGDARGGCGQIDILHHDYTLAPGWTRPLLQQFAAVWDRWHLNDMRAGCEHQREQWDTREKVEVMTYTLNHDGHKLRDDAMREAERAATEGRIANLTETGKALIGPDWFKPLHAAPDADSPLSGLYKVEKRETKTVGWVYPHEHPRGVLCKPCPVCGYRYGSAWCKESVPDSVISFLLSLPDTDKAPAWA